MDRHIYPSVFTFECSQFPEVEEAAGRPAGPVMILTGQNYY